MNIGLVPYQWKTDGGMSFWALPDGVTSAIDLRRLDQITDKTATGHAIAIYPDALPAGSVDLDTGNVTRDRDAWLSTLGYRPAGSNAVEWAWSHLMDGADDQFAAACRPLRGGRGGRIEMHLGGRHEWALSHTERLVQAVLIRRDLDAIFDDVQAGRLPDGMHRKALQAYADDLGIDPLTLRSKAARWRNETPLRPTTSITDEGNSGSYVSMTVYGWTETGYLNRWTTGSGLFRFSADGSGQQSWAWHPTSLSSSNNQSSLVNVTLAAVVACICRGNGGTGSSGSAWSGYILDGQSGNGNHNCYSVVLGVGTLITQVVRSGSDPRTWSCKAVGSSITVTGSTGATSTVTNTANTTGLRVGVYGYNSPDTSTFETFTARDFLTPASISTSPSSGPTAGGTSITITGTGFESNATVTVKGGSATGVSVASETSLTATTPSGTLGAGDVVVTNPDSGLSGTQSNGFTYVTTTTTTTTTSTTTTSTTTTTTLAARRQALGGRGLGSPYIGGYRPGLMRKD